MIRAMEQLLRPLRTRILNLVARAVVQLVADDGGLQIVQLGVLDTETRDGCERMQEYGLTSRPHPGAEAAVMFVGGRRDHGLVVAVDDRRYRLKSLQEGEVALYTDEGDHVKLSRGRIVEVVAGTRVRVQAPDATFSGNVEIAGTLQVTGAVTAQSSVAITGPVTAASTVAVAGAVTAPSVTAATVSSGGKILATHTHPYTDNGNSMTTGAPS